MLSTVSTTARFGTASAKQNTGEDAMDQPTAAARCCDMFTKAQDHWDQLSVPTTAFALLDCKCPMKCHLISCGSSGAFSEISYMILEINEEVCILAFDKNCSKVQLNTERCLQMMVCHTEWAVPAHSFRQSLCAQHHRPPEQAL